MENYADVEKIKKDLKQILSMGDDDAMELVKGYHMGILDKLSDCMKGVEEIAKLSPATIPVTRTAIIIAEHDFMDKDDELKLMGLIGDKKLIAELFLKIFKNAPEVFEEVVKKAGYVKA